MTSSWSPVSSPISLVSGSLIIVSVIKINSVVLISVSLQALNSQAVHKFIIGVFENSFAIIIIPMMQAGHSFVHVTTVPKL